ncbi:alpha-ketoglutarate-dependent dioxygenase alkB homolog 4 isoform X2 [Amia ocellicauda]|uniref:alpha-ketoglutarate-dependent dioxygenase alkB homolog 4 isoform X2 n=1 Tax=Amia ocellicauda TaxID=2972642 RepID=UPI0034649436
MAGEPKPVCACKGIRSCLLCEGPGKTGSRDTAQPLRFIYEPRSGRAVRAEGGQRHSFELPGVLLLEEFVSEEEEERLVSTMDRDPWMDSQSGRRKQDFGPKVNFKKQRVRLGGFSGLPPSSRELVQRMEGRPGLGGFLPVEQCNLDYCPRRGSAIDPHLDDAWLWGERLVTLNLLSDTVLTLSRGGAEAGGGEAGGELWVSVPLPRRSLLVLGGEARHRWKHAVLRQHITARRVCCTFRELSDKFLPGGPQGALGSELLDIALSFQGVPV